MNARGFVTVQWTLGLALVVLPAAAIVLSIAPWYQRAAVASLAAQEGARAAVLADDWTTALGSVEMIEERFGTKACGDGCLRLTLSSASGSLTRDAIVAVDAAIRMPAVVIPFAGEVGSFTYSVTHRERVDPYRGFP